MFRRPIPFLILLTLLLSLFPVSKSYGFSCVSGASQSYGYDARGFRVWKEVGGQRTYFYYTDEGLAAEFDSSGNLIRSYLYEPESYFGTAPLALRNGSGAGSAYYYFHTDHLGTPQKLVARNGATAWLARYSGYGAATVDIEGITNPLRFPGQYYDQESGLHQNFMRMYDPALGAYLEQDPYGVLTGPNRYAYAYGNPAALMDPTGELVPLAWWAVNGLIFIGTEIATGFPATKCFDFLFDLCLFGGTAEDCNTAAINAALSFGGGAAFRALGYFKPLGGVLLRFGRGPGQWLDELLGRVGPQRRIGGTVGDLLGAVPGKADDAFHRLLGRSGAADAPITVTGPGEVYVRVGANPKNLKMTFRGQGGTAPGTFAFPKRTFDKIGKDPSRLKDYGDLPGSSPEYYRELRPPAGTKIQHGTVPGRQYGGQGGVPEVFFPEGF